MHPESRRERLSVFIDGRVADAERHPINSLAALIID
jgi:hypothetical protein